MKKLVASLLVFMFVFSSLGFALAAEEDTANPLEQNSYLLDGVSIQSLYHDIEPNDGTDEASPFGIPGIVKGKVSWPDDRYDWYYFQPDRSGVARFDLTNLDSNTDLMLILADKNTGGIFQIVNDNGNGGNEVLLSNVYSNADPWCIGVAVTGGSTNGHYILEASMLYYH